MAASPISTKSKSRPAASGPWRQPRASESQPRYSPDGKYLALVRSNDSAKRIDGSRIVLLTLAGMKARELPPSADESPSLAGWAGGRMLFTETRGTRAVLYAMPLDGPPTVVFQPARGTFGVGLALNRTGSHAGLAVQSPDEPVEAYVMDLASNKPVRVSAGQHRPGEAACG